MALQCRYAIPVSYIWIKVCLLKRKAQSMLVLIFYCELKLVGSLLQTRASAVHVRSYEPFRIARAALD